MADLWSVLIPILLADVVNPVLFAFMVYAVGTARPLVNSSAVLVGHTFAYLSFGILFTFVYETITERLSNPQPIDFGVGMLVGLLLLWMAWRSGRGEKNEKQASEVGELTTLKAFGFGVVINLVGLPFALPYFAALDQILKADLSVMDSALVLTGYNLGYALPFLVVPGLAMILGEDARPILARINDKVDRASAFLMPLVLGLVGIALVADAVSFFATGRGLF